MRSFKLPEKYQQQIEPLLNDYGYSLEKPKSLATAVMDLSTRYQNKNHPPQVWDTPRDIAAYLSYFFPLNYLRARRVWREFKRVDSPFPDQFVDFGAGCGTMSLALLDELNQSPKEFVLVDQSSVALSLAKNFFDIDVKTSTKIQDIVPKTNSCLGMSYSLNELKNIPSIYSKFDSLVFIEPSTQVEGRQLMNLRKKIISEKFKITAPCVHQLNCPLLENSKKDWCHDRIFIEAPSWITSMEDFMPIKNRTLTLSYLSASKNFTGFQNKCRVIGDTLKEKGKIRQAICRDENREFFSWLKRDNHQFIERGSLVESPVNFEKKGNELRLKQVVKLFDDD